MHAVNQCMMISGQLWRVATRDALWGPVARNGLRQATTAASAGAGAGRVALVQGASRGLGLEFVRQLLERPDHRCCAQLGNRSADQLHSWPDGRPKPLYDMRKHLAATHGRTGFASLCTGCLFIVRTHFQAATSWRVSMPRTLWGRNSVASAQLTCVTIGAAWLLPAATQMPPSSYTRFRASTQTACRWSAWT